MGETDFDLNVIANLNSALVALAGGFGHSTVDYRIYGQVHLKGSDAAHRFRSTRRDG